MQCNLCRTSSRLAHLCFGTKHKGYLVNVSSLWFCWLVFKLSVSCTLLSEQILRTEVAQPPVSVAVVPRINLISDCIFIKTSHKSPKKLL